MASKMADTLVQLEELEQFLTVSTRDIIKCKALEYIQGVTSHGEFALELLQRGRIIKPLSDLLSKDPNPDVRRECVRTLVNLTINDAVASSPILLEKHVLETLTSDVLDKNSKMSDASAMLLTNLTRMESNIAVVQKYLKDITFSNILQAFLDNNYNPHCQLNYIGYFISNLLIVKHYRRIVLNDCQELLQGIIRYTTFETSNARRASAARFLKNCSFETDYHEWLLGEELGLLSQLLLPLAGPEDFAEDETEQLPLDLQYLPADKHREADPEIRILLINTLHQLCTTQLGREILRKNGVYYILRELHKWETNEMVLEALEPVVQLMIMDEPEPALENLKECEIPADVMQKLENSAILQT